MPSDAVQSLLQKLGIRELIGEGSAFTSEVRKIPIAAKCSVTVVITGETGTGKELFARAIHYLSARAGRPFTPVNCGAIPVDLVENELFGHAAGAFTTAGSSQDGLVAQSEGGTLFLDELDCLPLLAQVKLLRFLQEKEYRPLGAARARRADVRVIAASNANLETAVKEGRLRRDLYYRLNVLPICLPPLRERPSDVPLLAMHFLRKYSAEFQKPVVAFGNGIIESLMAYDWPGNVRELEHVIERAVLMVESEIIQAEDLTLPAGSPSQTASFREAKALAVKQFERQYLKGLLETHAGNISHAAQAARKDRRAFFELLRKHGLTRTNINRY